MPPLSPSTKPKTTAKTAIARVPYLNCAPFFRGLAPDGSWEWVEGTPRQLGEAAEQGRVVAGPMAVADYLRLQDRFERISNLGIAVRGRAHSVLLLSRRPIRQLDGAVIAVTDESSTSALMLRLILEGRYDVQPKAYERGVSIMAEARLVIGDEALKLQATNKHYPFETDVAFEWWLWHHLPAVFAVWVVRKDASPDEKQRISRMIQGQLAANLRQLDVLAHENAERLGVPADKLTAYLDNFHYRLSEPEEHAIKQFDKLLRERKLL